MAFLIVFALIVFFSVLGLISFSSSMLEIVNFCFRCYAINKIEDTFCYYCGSNLNDNNKIKRYKSQYFDSIKYKNLIFTVNRLTNGEISKFDASELTDNQIQNILSQISHLFDKKYSENDLNTLKKGFLQYIENQKYGSVFSFQREHQR
jgi:hypothetical protein